MPMPALFPSHCFPHNARIVSLTQIAALKDHKDKVKPVFLFYKVRHYHCSFSVLGLSSVGSLICVVHDAEGSLKEDYRGRQWPRNPEAPRQHLTKIVSSEEILAHT